MAKISLHNIPAPLRWHKQNSHRPHLISAALCGPCKGALEASAWAAGARILRSTTLRGSHALISAAGASGQEKSWGGVGRQHSS